MFQLDDTLTQIGGLTVLILGGGFNLRVYFLLAIAMVFTVWDGTGTPNIDRLEIIRVPMLVFMDVLLRAAWVNMISKVPRKESLLRLLHALVALAPRKGF